jgi:hypothetical protein
VKEWPLFEGLLGLPQVLAECFDCQVVILFYNFPHIRDPGTARANGKPICGKKFSAKAGSATP